MSSNTKRKSATVTLVKCGDYSPDEHVYASLKSLLSYLGGVESVVKPGERVLIKPNLLAGDDPRKAVTTHPSVIAGMVRLVKEAGAIPFIGDSPGAGSLEKVAVPTGMARVAEKHGVALVGLTTPVEVSFPEGIIKRLTVAREALDADAIISVSKLKTHAFSIFTGAVKNMFGVVPGFLKGDYHLRLARIESFSRMLLDVYAAVPARLHVMDAVWAMEGRKGPRAGNPRHVGALIASRDGIALDAVATSLVGKEPHSVPTTAVGHAEGKGVGDLRQIEILGDSLEQLRVTDFQGVEHPTGIADRLPPFLYNLLRNHIPNKPRIDRRACKLCMTCSKACPPQAIRRKPGRDRLVIDYNKCIRCYCCLETCPHDAVEIKHGLLARLRRH